jgi:hypothetical protein
MPAFCQNSSSLIVGGYHGASTFRGIEMKQLAIMVAVLLAACGKSSPPAATPAARTDAAVTKPALPGSAIVNADFEQTGSEGDIPGWISAQHAGPPSYTMRIDADGAYAGHGSFHITRTQPQVYGSLTQILDARAFAGKTVELSAMLKSRGVGAKGWALLISAKMPGTLRYSSELTGDSDWQRKSVQLQVPANAHQLLIGATLRDAGEGWMDDVRLIEMGSDSAKSE